MYKGEAMVANDSKISKDDKNLLIKSIIESLEKEEDLEKHKLILDELYKENMMLKNLLSDKDEVSLLVKRIEDITSDIDKEKGDLGLDIMARKEELKNFRHFFEMKESIFLYYLEVFRYVLEDK